MSKLNTVLKSLEALQEVNIHCGPSSKQRKLFICSVLEEIESPVDAWFRQCSHKLCDHRKKNLQSVAHLGADSFTGSNGATDLREDIMFHIGLWQVTPRVLQCCRDRFIFKVIRNKKLFFEFYDFELSIFFSLHN